MYQTLYRKYRPQNFDEVVGQRHIVQTLKGQIETKKLSHAYLFCGTRGTGKTTCARILAKALNCENLSDGNPCNECEACRIVNGSNSVDIIEIDAASNNGVENIRSLVEEVRYTPVELKKRVYIIDEVHMLTIQAFNALLKTLEEPPEHVVFILATTEIHKIPATIMSRCQRFDFKRISVEEITESLMSVASAEGISIERDAAKIIAKMSDGAMRNAYSMLESCMGFDGMVTMDVMINRLGISNRESIIKLISFIAGSNSAGALKIISEVYEAQNDFTNVLNELLKIYRDLLILKSVPSCEIYLECYDNELGMLKEICNKMDYSELCHHSEAIQKLVENVDRYGNTIRAAFEVTVMKLCGRPIYNSAPVRVSQPVQNTAKPPVQPSPTAFSDDDVPWETKPSLPQENASEKTAKAPETQTAPAMENVSDGYAGYAIFREEVARRIPEISPFFDKVTAECQGTRLFLKCSDMLVKMILSNNINLPKIKGIVSEISPDISDVVVTDKATAPKTDNQDDDF